MSELDAYRKAHPGRERKRASTQGLGVLVLPDARETSARRYGGRFSLGTEAFATRDFIPHRSRRACIAPHRRSLSAPSICSSQGWNYRRKGDSANEPVHIPVKTRFAFELINHSFNNSRAEAWARRPQHRRAALSIRWRFSRPSASCNHFRPTRPSGEDRAPYFAALVASSWHLSSVRFSKKCQEGMRLLRIANPNNEHCHARRVRPIAAGAAYAISRCVTDDLALRLQPTDFEYAHAQFIWRRCRAVILVETPIPADPGTMSSIAKSPGETSPVPLSMSFANWTRTSASGRSVSRTLFSSALCSREAASSSSSPRRTTS
jgi:hypothetical protein